MMVLICGVLAGAVGFNLRRQFAASIGRRPRATHHHLFGQHVSPQVADG